MWLQLHHYYDAKFPVLINTDRICMATPVEPISGKGTLVTFDYGTQEPFAEDYLWFLLMIGASQAIPEQPPVPFSDISAQIDYWREKWQEHYNTTGKTVPEQPPVPSETPISKQPHGFIT